MRQEIRRLIGPAIYAREASERLSKNLKRPVDLETPLWFREVCDKLEELVLELDREVPDWRIGSSLTLWMLTRTIFVTSVKRT